MAKTKKRVAPPVESYGDGIVARNKRASFDFELGDRFEAGLVLRGTEVKMLRLGTAELRDCYVRIERNEAWLLGLNIPELQGAPFNHRTKRPRKLLLHRREIDQLHRATEREGMTAVATMIYFRRGKARIEVALAKGKRQVDKRETMKRKQADREAQAEMDRARRGRSRS